MGAQSTPPTSELGFFLAQQGGRVILRQAKLCFSSFFLNKIKSREKKEKRFSGGVVIFFLRLAFKSKNSESHFRNVQRSGLLLF